jgi:hypothetical protein
VALWFVDDLEHAWLRGYGVATPPTCNSKNRKDTCVYVMYDLRSLCSKRYYIWNRTPTT